MINVKRRKHAIGPPFYVGKPFQSSFVCSLSFVKAATVMIFSCRQASLRDNVFGFLAISFSAPRTLDFCFQYSYLPLAQAVCYCTLV